MTDFIVKFTDDGRTAVLTFDAMFLAALRHPFSPGPGTCPQPVRGSSALLTYVWGKMTTEAGSVKGVLMAVGVAKLEEETHG